ncbi:MAG TPA: type II secretion system F family protein [Nocardioidaceae bacterium]|nr:type II secretion system F family protein [Nocardioidaceae bacterium]
MIGLVALLGAGVAAGIVALVALSRGRRLTLPEMKPSGLSEADRRRLTYGIPIIVLVALVTRWPIAVLAAVVILLLWPRIAGATGVGQAALDQLEALAIWTESMRDITRASTGLEEAIPITAESAPEVLRPSLQRLSDQLASRIPLDAALRDFAADADDAGVDYVVAALILNVRTRGPELAAVLTRLADSTRAELAMRQEVEAERRRLRRHTWIMFGIVAVWIAVQLLVARDHLEPFGQPAGQVVLAGVVTMWIFAAVRARTLSEPVRPARFLASPDPVGGGGFR